MSAFASLVGIPIDIAGSAVGLIACAITMVIKKCKSIVKEKEKQDESIVSRN